MAIIDVKPDWNRSTGGRFDLSSRRLILTSQRGYTIAVSDASNDTPRRVKQAHVAPIEGDADPDDPNLICVSADYKNRGPILIEVVANYESIPLPEPDGGGQGPVPGWSIEIDSEDSQEPVDRALAAAHLPGESNVPIITVTREQFDPPLTMDISDLALIFTAQNRPFNAGALWLYRNAVNSDNFLGFPPGTARIKQARGRVSQQGAETSTEVSVRVVFRLAAPGSINRRAWWKRIRAEGYYLLTDGGSRVRAKDANDDPVATPVLHAINSVSGGISRGNVINNEKLAEFYEFQHYRELEFANFFTPT